MAGAWPEGRGVSRFGALPRTAEDEETPGSESDASNGAPASTGDGLAGGDGQSIGFSSVSVEGEFDPTVDMVSEAQTRRIRLQLRAVHASLKEKIKDEAAMRQ